jgi:hypothetical protein
VCDRKVFFMSSARNTVTQSKVSKVRNEIVFLSHINCHRNQITSRGIIPFAGMEMNAYVELMATQLSFIA